MTISENSASRSLSRDVLYAARYYLLRRPVLIATTAVGLGAGAYFNWGWLVAAGLAPIILAMAPCGVMCALGLCMKRTNTDEADRPDPLTETRTERDITVPKTGKAAESGRNHKGCC